jgi:cyclophilin family peptidyl-prolyl cis-trans isomerase
VMANTGQPDTGGGQWFVITGTNGASLPPQYSIIGRVTAGYSSTVQALENLADPLAENGTPPLVEIDITSIKITESDAPPTTEPPAETDAGTSTTAEGTTTTTG